jgi:hypothetical protein
MHGATFPSDSRVQAEIAEWLARHLPGTPLG